jgi:hypothetical protein
MQICVPYERNEIWKNELSVARDLKLVCWGWGDYMSLVPVIVDVMKGAALFTVHLNSA